MRHPYLLATAVYAPIESLRAQDSLRLRFGASKLLRVVRYLFRAEVSSICGDISSLMDCGLQTRKPVKTMRTR